MALSRDPPLTVRATAPITEPAGREPLPGRRGVPPRPDLGVGGAVSPGRLAFWTGVFAKTPVEADLAGTAQ
ncbi:hypothetical protein Sme01_09050 [Sphaerisporangium melleum]|uniref:Uncharacterized protein n=1 Tax=Sphaerisporangium melleum TaxID=321316 RepID=A0A917VEJ9_9ACTN|nr:hypothetical protein GCM10007964_08560 [Sphaerisporangium melleum]GII68429.1 hypothetical protein Sme01_09050 [Sphaerisporangium melleum]